MFLLKFTKQITSFFKNNAVEIMYAFVAAFMFFGVFSFVNTNAQTLQIFDVLGVGCLIEGQKDAAGTVCKEGLLNRIINFLTILSVPLAVFVIIWGGYQYFIGGFDGKSNGKSAITAAVIGLLIVTLANFIVNSLVGANGIIGSSGQFNTKPAIALIKTFINALASLAAAVAVLVFTWGGYKYFFSGLDIDKEDGAKAIKNGIMGLVVVYVTFSIFDTIASIGEKVIAGGTQNPITLLIDSIIKPFVGDITSILLNLATAFAIFVIMYGGYKFYFMGAGFSKEDGVKNIRNGVIGLIAIFVARGVVEVVKLTLNVAGTAANPIGFNSGPIFNFIALVTGGILLPISSAAAVFFFVLAGFYWTTSSGDDGKSKKALTALRNSIIGLVVTLAAATIVAFVRFIFGAGI